MKNSVGDISHFASNLITVKKTYHRTAIKRHEHVFYEFVFVEKGFAIHNCNGITSILTPGDLFAVFPNHFHNYISPQNNIIYNCLFVKEGLGRDINEILHLPGIDYEKLENCNKNWNKVHMNPAESVEIIRILETMITEEEQKKTGWKLRMKAGLIDLLALYSRAYEDKYEERNGMIKNHSDKVYKALAYLEKNYANSKHIHDMAEEFNINADYLSKIFKHATGLTPSEYLINLRLAKAVELLNSTDLSIAEISVKVGFDDPAYFARQFKKTMGLSPSSYKKDINPI